MSTALSLSELPSPSKRTQATRLKLTEQRIASLAAPPAGVIYIYDTITPSLAVRVASTGQRSFVVVKKINGTAQRITLGRYPGLRLDDARQATRTIAGEIAKGDDPVALRKAARARKTKLSDLWPSYLSHLKQRNRTWRRDQQRWQTEVSPTLGKKALVEVTRSDCQALIDRIGADRPIAANRVAAFLSALLNFAVRSDRLAVNPARGLVRFQETSRSRVLKSDELESLIKAIEAERAPWDNVFLILLFTGARRGSVVGMRWEDVDLGAAIWTIPAQVAKNKTATPIPLTQPAVRLLQQQLERAAGEPWVFPSSIGDGHLVGLPKAWARVLRRAKIKNLRIHDIRRSVGTAMARTGASPHLIATGLGHRSIASARAYVRLAGEEARQALSDAVASLTIASTREG
ncbi:tyrosine-type recombinase/integrase [Bradyrhizobium brasilense]|uniref:tyrosine-type recombinase/integrase n=1 Tax=Bradyrhizobium brasilense TaxID=1419277 RepID=UPI00130105DD|nr:site-specific integrase [Bradyrhizobium brasilense]